MSRPSTIQLPPQFINQDIIEKLPPNHEPVAYGRPFWTSGESFSLKIDNSGKLYLSRKIQSIIKPFNVLDYHKGYFCIGGEPGSWPQPFIIVHNDEENQELGLIFPYVSILSKDNETVSLHVGGDCTKYYDSDCPYATTVDEKVKTQDLNYKVIYYKYDDFLTYKGYQAHGIGTFGNHDLPDYNGELRYDYIY